MGRSGLTGEGGSPGTYVPRSTVTQWDWKGPDRDSSKIYPTLRDSRPCGGKVEI